LLRTTAHLCTLPCPATMVRTRAVQGSEPSSCLTPNPRAASDLREAEPHSARHSVNCLRFMGRSPLKRRPIVGGSSSLKPDTTRRLSERSLIDRAEAEPLSGLSTRRLFEQDSRISFAFRNRSSSACARFPRALLSGHVRASRRSSDRSEPTRPHEARRPNCQSTTSSPPPEPPLPETL